MIRFDFSVSDADAENIFQIMRERINHNNWHILGIIDEPEKNEKIIAVYRRDNEYVEGLIKKMTNTRVAE